MKLKEVAEIAMGYQFRSRVEQESGGNVAVIQMRDLAENDVLRSDGIAKISLEKPHQRHFVKKGDIVFRSRGQTNTCVQIEQEIGDAVIAAPLFRIRVKSEKVIPGYLYWLINLPSTQDRLASHARGTALRMISKKDLENLEISIPPLERQELIVQLAKLTVEEQQLMALLAQKRKQYMDGILMQVASESQR